MTRETYTVGRLADDLGVTTRTLRFYEEAGIVTPARSGSGSARVYDARDRARLVLALRGRRFGMSLAEIREIVDMYDAEPGEAGQIERLLESLERVRVDLRARRAEITRTLHEVDDVTRRCLARLEELAARGTSGPRATGAPGVREDEPGSGEAAAVSDATRAVSAPARARGSRSGRLGATAGTTTTQAAGAHPR